MPTTTITLRLTDGTTTCDFSSTSTAFSLRQPGWEPAVAQLRPNELGGQSAYGDVDEVIPLYVRGNTAALAQANLRALEQLLTQAVRFDRGYNVLPVRLECQMQGSDLAVPLQARVRGGYLSRVGAEYAEGSLYATAGIPIEVTVTRTGLWHGPEEASNSVTGFRSYDKTGLTFGTTLSGTHHPTRIEIAGLTTSNGNWYPGYLVLAPTANHIGISDGEATFDTSGTTQTNANVTARGDAWRRFTISTGNDASGFGTTELANSQSITYLVSTSKASGTWTAVGRVYFDTGGSLDTPAVTVPVHATGPTTVPIIWALPSIYKTGTASIGEIFFIGSGILDLDWLAVIGDGRIVQIGNPGGYGTTTPSLVIDPRAIDGRRPSVRVFNGSVPNKDVSYEGDAYLSSGSNTIGVGWFQNENHPLYAQFGITTSGAGSAAKTHTITAYRRRAFVIPE